HGTAGRRIAGAAEGRHDHATRNALRARRFERQLPAVEVDGRGVVVAQAERGGGDRRGRHGDAQRVRRIAARVQLVAVEVAVLVAVDAHAYPGAERGAGVGELLPRHRGQGTEVVVRERSVGGTVELEDA